MTKPSFALASVAALDLMALVLVWAERGSHCSNEILDSLEEQEPEKFATFTEFMTGEESP